jgi:hypothetical protein
MLPLHLSNINLKRSTDPERRATLSEDLISSFPLFNH